MTSIFLSYARGDDEPFVERLDHALRARGFDIWWDRVSMPSRLLTFHQEIRDAVAACERVVLVVGPKSVASEYVRQEWNFALNEDKVVTPILRLGDYALVPDELRLFHHEDFRDDARFDFHLDNLVRQLSEPPAPLGKLIAVPSLPAHYLARADRLAGLRDALRADLDRPVVIGGAAARVGLHGMGGIGKSVLAAALARDRKIRAAFPDGIVWIGLGALPDVVGLQRRVHRDLGGDGAFETEHEGKLGLKKLLEAKAVLLILDDVWRRVDVDWFDVLGPRCRALVTTRDAGLLTSLGGTHHPVELLSDYESHGMLALSAGISRDGLPSEAAPIIAECGRLPLAVALCGGMIRRGLGWSAVLQQLRQARIDRIADRHAVEPHHQSVWHAIHVSVEFLPPVDRQRFLELVVFPADEATPEAAIGTLWAHTGGLDDWGTQELLVTLAERSLIQMTTVTSGAGPLRQVSLHDLLYDYAERATPDPKSLHGQLLEAYRARCANGWASGPNDGYFFSHLRNHLIEAGRVGELADLLQELRWLETKNEAGLTLDLVADFGAALEDLPPDDSRRKILRLLDEAIRPDLQFIARHFRDYPQALFQCLWNTASWHDHPDAAKYCEAPTGGWSAGGPPWEQPGPKLYQLLEKWREHRARHNPSAPWLRALRPCRNPLGTCLRLSTTLPFTGPPAYAPDGRHLMSGGYVMDSANGRVVAEHRCVTHCYAPDGRRIAIATREKTVQLVDAESGAELVKWTVPDKLKTLHYSPDGERLAADFEAGAALLWDARTGQEIARLGHEVECLAFSPDGSRLAGGDGKAVFVWDAKSGEERLCFREHTERVSCLAFSPDGKCVASATACHPRALPVQSPNDYARIFATESGLEVTVLAVSPGTRFERLEFFPDGNRLIEATSNSLRVWDIRSASELCSFSVVRGWALARLPAALLAIIDETMTLKLFDSGSFRELVSLGRIDFVPRGLAFSPDGRRLALMMLMGAVRIWDTATSTQPLQCWGPRVTDRNLMFSPDGSLVTAEVEDGRLGVWETTTGRLLGLSPVAVAATGAPRGSVIAFSLDNRRIAAIPSKPLGSNPQAVDPLRDNKTVLVWEAGTGRQLACLRGHQDEVCSVAFSFDGRFLATGARDFTARIWDAGTGRELQCLTGHSVDVTCVAFSPDGQLLATGGANEPYATDRPKAVDQSVRLWSTGDGRQIACLTGTVAHIGIRWIDGRAERVQTDERDPAGPVNSVSFSPDGRRLVTAHVNRRDLDTPTSAVIVWTVDEQRQLASYSTSGDFVAEFAADGKQIYGVASGCGGRGQIWEAGAGGCVKMIEEGENLGVDTPKKNLAATLGESGSPYRIVLQRKTFHEEEIVIVHATSGAAIARWPALGTMTWAVHPSGRMWAAYITSPHLQLFTLELGANSPSLL